MGATGWYYFVPYQADINQALQDLRSDVFARGEYENTSNVDIDEAAQAMEKLLALYPPEIAEIQRQQMENLLDLIQSLPKPRKHKPPKTIKGLLRQCAENGTHCILDIERIAAEPDFATIWPLSDAQLMDFFGTTRPTHTMVEAWAERIDPIDAEPLYKRWQGIYLIVYQDDQPVEIYFEGCSGD